MEYSNVKTAKLINFDPKIKLVTAEKYIHLNIKINSIGRRT